MSTESDRTKCNELGEDFRECLHHKKEVRKLSARPIPTASRHRALHARAPPLALTARPLSTAAFHGLPHLYAEDSAEFDRGRARAQAQGGRAGPYPHLRGRQGRAPRRAIH